jgi:gamma-glutamylcyclotransferase (GGCT)/AIG2-like uncharacterized protein YtfP
MSGPDAVLPLAVYGTLRPGGRAYAAFALDQRTRHIGPCRIPGRIVDLGGYPGLLPAVEGEASEVIADLLEILDPALWDELDAYEGPDYRRATVRLNAPEQMANVWLWRHGAGDAAPVPGNDWTLRQSDEIDPADDPTQRGVSGA